VVFLKPIYTLSLEILFVWVKAAIDKNVAAEKSKIFFHHDKFDALKVEQEAYPTVMRRHG
jgi:hypothetical protein